MDHDKNQNGQNKATDQTAKNVSFERDSYYMSFILKKTEKLVTALYLITDFLNPNEPLKWEIRSKSVRLMSFVSASASQNSSADGMPFNRTVGTITDILSVLELASSLRLVSEMNFSILRDEFANLRSLIEGRERANNPIADISFSREFFATGIEPRLPGRTAPRPMSKPVDESAPQPPAAAVVEAESEPDSHSRGVEGHAFGEPGMHAETRFWHRAAAVRPVAGLSLSRRADTLPKRDEKSLRQETILKFLRSRGDVSIKDIAAVIPNCSEKTVQRELIELIESGLVARAGERRWSTYNLVKQG